MIKQRKCYVKRAVRTPDSAELSMKLGRNERNEKKFPGAELGGIPWSKGKYDVE